MTRSGNGRAQLVLCGLGGQGILFLTRLLAEAALAEGRDVLLSEAHGMSQRGGAVEAHLKLGGFAGSLVRRGRADLVLVLDPGRIEAGLAYRRAGGELCANAPQARPGVRCIDATGLARGLEHPRGANLVLLGFAAGSVPARLPATDTLKSVVDRLSPSALGDANRAAFDCGLERATEALR